MTNKIHKAICDGTIDIGDMSIQCAVLENNVRVLSERSISKIFGGKGGGAHWKRKKFDDGAANLPAYFSAKNLRNYINNKIQVPPIEYINLSGRTSTGISAELLPEYCKVLLEARDDNKLHWKQIHLAHAADILMRALATVGIIALVDEATGFQDKRTRDALNQLLEKFIAKELQKWTKTFPDEFYQNMFELNGWQYNPSSVKRPGIIGKYTNDLVYERLAPGVLTALQERNPKDLKGRRKYKHFQYLTPEEGMQELKQHLWALIGLMRVATSWRKLKEMVERAFPKIGETQQLLLEMEDEYDVKEQ